MFELPKTTYFYKRIPKEKFYENLSISPMVKKHFVDQINMIYWRNKIAVSTTNLAIGNTVTEIEVFELKLKSNTLDETVLCQIDKKIPYHILFLLEYEGKYQAWIGYKEAITGNAAFKVNQYYHTEWMIEDNLPLKMEGMNLDAVYENFVRQLAGDLIGKSQGTQESLQESIQRSEQKARLQKQIEILQTKIRKEKQLNKQMEMNAQLKKLRKEMEVII